MKFAISTARQRCAVLVARWRDQSGVDSSAVILISLTLLYPIMPISYIMLKLFVKLVQHTQTVHTGSRPGVVGERRRGPWPNDTRASCLSALPHDATRSVALCSAHKSLSSSAHTRAKYSLKGRRRGGAPRIPRSAPGSKQRQLNDNELRSGPIGPDLLSTPAVVRNTVRLEGCTSKKGPVPVPVPVQSTYLPCVLFLP